MKAFPFHRSQKSLHLETLLKTDDLLAKEARHSGDAFAELYRRYLNRVYSYQMARVGNFHDAQDLTAQTFLAAQESIASFQGRGKFAAWLMGIARRKSADYFRRYKATLPLELADGVAASCLIPEEAIDRQLPLEQIACYLGYLTPDRAEVIALRIFAGLTAAEVAQVMGKSEAAAKMLVCRALTDLQKHLDCHQEKKS